MLTLMPLSSAALTGGKMREYLVAAAQASAAMEDPDPDLIVPPDRIDSPLTKWSSHSLRRLADTRMRRHCQERGIPLSKVDAFLGWKQAEHRLDMQEHYDADSLRARMETARATQRLDRDELPPQQQAPPPPQPPAASRRKA